MTPIIQLILGSLPTIISTIQDAHAKANPGAPVPTADEIVAAFEEAFTATILKDELIKASHAGQP